MKIVSLNTGRPKAIFYQGHTVTSGIFKHPVERRLRVTILNLEGDKQEDLAVHGGPSKAVYRYPSEHYKFWRRERGADQSITGNPACVLP
jgi:MOSC domain-containing protein YiiM